MPNLETTSLQRVSVLFVLCFWGANPAQKQRGAGKTDAARSLL